MLLWELVREKNQCKRELNKNIALLLKKSFKHPLTDERYILNECHLIREEITSNFLQFLIIVESNQVSEDLLPPPLK